MRRLCLMLLPLLLAIFVLGGCDKPRDPQNVPEMKEKLSKFVSVIMWKIDATRDQKDRMDKLLDGLAVDFFAFQEENNVIKRGLIDALGADPLDRAALDALQKKGLDLFDRYTKCLVQASSDIADILTLEQRRELVDMWRDWEF